MILAEHVTNCANDVNQLEAAVQGVDPTVGKPIAEISAFRVPDCQNQFAPR